MSFDAIIVGAGIIGSSIAWRLAQRGSRVLLLDAGRMGGEASSAGAGMLAPGGEVESRSAWNDFALESLRLYSAFVAELTSETGCPIDFRRSGAVEVALTEAEWEAIKTRRGNQQPLGIRSQPISREEIRTLVPGVRTQIEGAMLYPEDALVDPYHVMHALRTACIARRVEIRDHLAVSAIRPRKDSVELVAGNGILAAPIAVLAAGAWSSGIPAEGLALPRAYPVRGHLMGWQLAPDSLSPIVRHGHTYLLQRTSGFTIAGTSSEEVGFDRQCDPAILSDIHKRASGLFPALEGRVPEREWVGFRPAIEASGPAIGRWAGTRLWLAYGHYRNGILMAPATAERVAREVIASSETGSSGPIGKH